MHITPDTIALDFEKVALGYLADHPTGLRYRAMKMQEISQARHLSKREWSIFSAIRWGIQNPQAWKVAQKPIKLQRRPVFTFGKNADA